MASAIACHAAVFGQFQAHLRPGERATILCLAVDRQQARIIFGYIRAYFELVPLLVPLVARVTDTAIELNNGVDVVVATNSFRAIRGRTVALAILDELSFWRDESGRYVSPDVEVYAALVPALSTLRQAGAMIVGIASATASAPAASSAPCAGSWATPPTWWTTAPCWAGQRYCASGSTR